MKYKVNLDRLINCIYMLYTIVFVLIVLIGSVWLNKLSGEILSGMFWMWTAGTVIAAIMLLLAGSKKKVK